MFFRYNTPANVVLLTCGSDSGLQTSCDKFSTVLPAFQPLRVCDGSLVALRIDTRLKGLGLFFCTVITGTLQRVVRCFDKMRGFGRMCDWRAKNEVTKSVLSTKKKKPSEKKSRSILSCGVLSWFFSF